MQSLGDTSANIMSARSSSNWSPIGSAGISRVSLLLLGALETRPAEADSLPCMMAGASEAVRQAEPGGANTSKDLGLSREPKHKPSRGGAPREAAKNGDS